MLAKGREPLLTNLVGSSAGYRIFNAYLDFLQGCLWVFFKDIL